MIASLLVALTLAAAPVEADEVERATAWPELSGREQKQVETEVQRLRKARTEAMGAEAHGAIVATGAAAAPALLKALGKEKDEAALERVQAALAEITGAAHTRLLAEEFDSKSSLVRTWSLERCARFHDPGIAGPAKKALDSVSKRYAKKADKTLKAERIVAALCVSSTGELDGLEILLEEARSTKSWGRYGEATRLAIEPLRGPEASQAVAKQTEGDREDIVAGLRLLAGCGDESAKSVVRKHLGSSDNSVRVAAINAARGIVDGDPPVDRLPVFEAVELAKRWQQKL